MQNLSLLFLFIISLTYTNPSFCQKNNKKQVVSTLASPTAGMEKYEGYFDFYYDAKEGKIWLEVEKLEQEFLYVNSLPAGIGSNDIGLDRNQLGGNRIVKFQRSGNKLLLVQPNYDYRAISDNIEEQKSVREAFAQSVLWGFTIKSEEKGKLLIDFTPFLMRDAHGVAARLKQDKQGSYSLDGSRSALYLERTKSFPKNSEFEATLTFTGKATGQYIRSVAPDASAITVRQHHSFIELPDNNYKPRVFDPRCGYFGISYQDYATPISEPLTKRFINRHRLEKKNPTAAVSEAVEPIVYYLDRGTPEPIRSALIEGASWWNQAFTAAGYKDAFQVKVLPADADPMDVRYNVINWVHRSTRGWSYGSSVSDPRTGEIIKGHVLLGSLRVRQDFLIAQGLIEAYQDGKTPDPRMEAMALARLRQLSAHEVGHTIGLAHNFAASYNDRASVMDYPHPYIFINDKKEMDFSEAYDTKIGDWDKRTVLYGYQDFPKGVDEAAELKKILKENTAMGFQYMSDRDARPMSGAHPTAHLWDNGKSASAELERMIQLRATALENFGTKNIPEGTPMATLENVLVPVYLMHRYQVEAVAKNIGGVNYTYAVNGDQQATNEILPAATQREALSTLLKTLEPHFLALPESIISLIPPQPMGYYRNKELFNTHTGLTFDPLAAAESSASNTIDFLLNSARLTRLIEQVARDQEKNQLDIFTLMDKLLAVGQVSKNASNYQQELARMVQKLIAQKLMHLANNKSINGQVAAAAYYQLGQLENSLKNTASSKSQQAHQQYLLNEINKFRQNPADYKAPKAPELPAGSPIGCGHFH